MVKAEGELVGSLPPAASFVGRAAPLAVLRRCLDDALAGRPRAVLVEGDAGIGKSRLVRELFPAARRHGAAVLVGRCREGIEVPYLPFATALEPLGDELGAAIQLVDPGAAPPVEPLAATTESERRVAPIIAACRAMVSAARRRPVVLLIEDLHWADPNSAMLFEEITASALQLGATSPTAMLVAATLRPPSDHVAAVAARLRREIEVSSIRLGGLDELELNDLLTVLARARPARSVLSQFAEATGGNPLLVRTLFERLLETGGIEIRGGELVSSVGEMLPPLGGLDDELRRRLDRVGRPCRDLLVTAAFLGDGGLLADLEALAPSGFDVLLDEAESSGLLHDEGERYQFDHPLLRHLLYSEPGGRRRQRLHRRLADVLESRHGLDSRRAAEIADHLRRSGADVNPSRLAHASTVAGEQALALGAWGAGARYLDLALTVDPPTDPRQRARLALRAGIGHFRDHDLGGVETRLREAIAGATAVGDHDTWAVAALLLTRAWMTIGPGSVGALIDTSVLEQLLAESDRDDRRAGEAVGLLAEVRFHAFDFAGGMQLLDEARRLAARNEDDELATSVEFAAGLQHLGRLELDTAGACFRASAGHARRLPDPWRRVWGVGRLPLVEMSCGELAAAADHADEAAGIAAANHDWAEHALASACTMQVAAARGDFAAVERLGAAAVQMYRRSDYAFVPVLAYPALAAVRSARGDVAGADEALDDWAAAGGRSLVPYRLLVLASTLDRDALASARPFRPIGDRPVNVFTLPVLCAQVEVGALLGDSELVADAVGPLAAVHEAGVRWCLSWPLLIARLLATANRVLERDDEAERWCAVAFAEATSGGAAGELARVALERARLASARGDDAAADELAADAAAALDALGMLPLAQQARRMIGEGMSPEPVERTILFTDLVDSTAINVSRGDAAYLELLQVHNGILRRRLRQFDGVEIKHTGDGIGSWFSSAASACACAVATCDDLAEHNASRPDSPLHVRFGLASGSPIAHEGDLFGVSMSLAARLCDQAGPNEVLAAEQVVSAAGGTGLTFRPLDPFVLKGFPEPVAAFAVGGRADIHSTTVP